MVRRVRSLSPATCAICHATASEDAMPDPPSRIRRKLDCLKPISTRNTPQPVRKEMIDPLYEQTEVLAREDIATASPTWSPAPAPQRHRRAMDHAHRTALTASARPARSRRTVAHRVATETDACGWDAPAPGANLSIADGLPDAFPGNVCHTRKGIRALVDCRTGAAPAVRQLGRSSIHVRHELGAALMR